MPPLLTWCVRRLHRDERGTISIVSVFAVMFLAMLLGMVMNVGREVDDKVRMQNAADAAAYGGGVVLARGMNGLAFTNHLHSGGPAGRGPMLGVLWRSSVVPVGAASDAMDRTLPVVDPVWDLLPNQAQYLDLARRQRRDGAVRYLQHWNDVAMVMFDREAKMCQFSRLWRHFTCAALNQLLDEYATSNLPFLIRTEGDDIVNGNQHLDQYFSFASVVYWAKTPQMLPGLFRDPIDGDALTYAQVRLFVPRRRIVWHWYDPTPTDPIAGNIGGHDVPLPPPDNPIAPVDNGPGRWVLAREPGISEEWNLLNQHWTVQLVPATMPTLAEILQTVPPVPGGSVRLPSLGGLTTEDINRISPH
ncbi:MAG: pilus assembly protein TadG-related protein [Planctomycetia bacterium]|nr:pilus assembly protein TadG-related protein [Planctomycetia bacterium]